MLGARSGLFAAFMGALASMGGSFEPVETKRSEKVHTGSPARLGSPRPLSAKQYHVHANGRTILRNTPKRDKSMSARQWRRQVKATRREAKAA
jgi:hypothetical protein